MRVRKLVKQTVNECRLPAADLASDDRNAGMVQNAIFQHCISKPVAAAPIKKGRVRLDGKGLFRQPKELFVHIATMDGAAPSLPDPL